jgi:hypothetical protein
VAHEAGVGHGEPALELVVRHDDHDVDIGCLGAEAVRE